LRVTHQRRSELIDEWSSVQFGFVLAEKFETLVAGVTHTLRKPNPRWLVARSTFKQAGPQHVADFFGRIVEIFL
jgi:hypothetical protein